MIRRLPLVLLCLVFALTGYTTAPARSQMAQGDAIVICSGYGIVTIVVDGNGDPLGSVHPCPDCILHMAVVLPPGAPTVLRPATRAEPFRAQAPGQAAGARPAVAHARDPPTA